MTKYIHYILPIVQIVTALLLTVSILLQQRGTTGGGLFGAGAGVSYYTKRGFEKVLFVATIVLAVLFIVSVLLNLVLA